MYIPRTHAPMYHHHHSRKMFRTIPLHYQFRYPNITAPHLNDSTMRNRTSHSPPPLVLLSTPRSISIHFHRFDAVRRFGLVFESWFVLLLGGGGGGGGGLSFFLRMCFCFCFCAFEWFVCVQLDYVLWGWVFGGLGLLGWVWGYLAFVIVDTGLLGDVGVHG
ncbi:hypothetical protein BDW02DRAFT_98822 [Decorospora gaudefroyi]|uniref:Transmembrane protein n=1 Tax=Decorospora gaudefroyi TaxID=184978 RepID=A0A6A5K387_9PLEO|nr:hypothetical protein BDW02DRAFT_98822 [Decorospora gaudefroyi]